MNKPVAYFNFNFEGDGASNTVAISLATGPVFYTASNSGALPPLFNTTPSGVKNLTAGGLTITGSTLLLGILTITFSANPNNGSFYTVSGFIEF